jgi:Rv0078B-related antitoxin
VNALRRDDLERARSATPEERARDALAAMRTGIRLKRAALRVRNPSASEERLEELLGRWLERRE